MTNNFFYPGKIFQYYLPLTLLLFLFVTIERKIETDGSYDTLYGLPLPYITSAFAYTWHSHVFLMPMAINLLFFFGFSVLLFAGLGKLGLQLKLHWALAALSILVILLCAFYFYILGVDSDFYLENDIDYETISRKLIINL